MVYIAGETLFIYFLGTSGALPTVTRNLPAILLKWGSHDILFDCGEGTQQQMMRARTGFGVSEIFITHWHADHYLGIIGLLQTLTFNGRLEPLTIFGPDAVYEIVEDIKRICRTRFSFPVEAVRVRPGQQYDFKGFVIRICGADHGIPAVGYCFIENQRPGRFNREEAIALGVKPGPLFGKLQRGESVTVQVHGGEEQIIMPQQVLGPQRSGRKVLYTGDTRLNIDNVLDSGVGVDLLIHDATFDNEQEERAREFFHATAGDAGTCARELNARMLALFHISSRYTQTALHKRDAADEFSGDIIIPDDLDMTEIPFHD